MSSAFFMLKFLKNRLRIKQLNTIISNPPSHLENHIDNEIYTCRVCMKEAKISIFDQRNTFDIAVTLSSFGGIQISSDDDYPKHICEACYNFLTNAISFRRSAQESDRIFRENSLKLNDDFNTLSEGDDNNQPNEPSSRSYRCKLCKLNFQSEEDLIAHRNTKSHKNVRIQCYICQGILTAQLYKKHLARHKSATHLICDICGKLYRKGNLMRHLQLHSYELPFQCQLCPYRGRFMESLKIHVRTHTGNKPFSCDKCELRFLTRSNLNRHLLTHKKERPYKCAECGRGFHSKRDMDTHFMVDHTGLKDYNCRLCGNKYGTRKALMRHELRVHKRVKMAKGRVPLYMQSEYQNISHKQFNSDIK